MAVFKSFFTLLGVLAFLFMGFAGYQGYARYQRFDPGAMAVHWQFAEALMRTGSTAAATTWRVKVEEDVSWEDVEEAMKQVANEHNIQLVAELPLYQQVEAMRGEAGRFVKIYMFCNALTAANMLAFDDAVSASLPCRITLLEDKSGQYWLYAMNMDLLIYGGDPLPEALKTEVIEVKQMMLDIMQRGAAGEF